MTKDERDYAEMLKNLPPERLAALEEIQRETEETTKREEEQMQHNLAEQSKK